MPHTTLPDDILHRLTPAALHEVLAACRDTGHQAAERQVQALLLFRAFNVAWPWLMPTTAPDPPRPTKGKRKRLPPITDL